ncbi:HID1 [Sergentomyia squamirostris]
MGNTDTKLNFRKAIVQLTTKNQQIDASDDSFWDQLWSDHCSSIQDVFALVPPNEIRALRQDNPANLATLLYKATERLVRAVDSSCRTQAEQQIVLNCVHLLQRILPYIFEDSEWKNFFWSQLPSGNEGDDSSTPLAQSLLNAICDLLFCPDFTVVATRRSGPDKAEELTNIDSCEYIWEAGVGFAQSPPKHSHMEVRRTELLKLLLTCFSETMYRAPSTSEEANKWIGHFTSADNRHALPLFTSLLNTVCAYDPVGLGVPYNHLLFTDTMEPLVEVCLQILIVTLDHDMTLSSTPTTTAYDETSLGDNLFINYLSRVHRDEDFHFILRGITRLLNNPLVQSYLPNSTKRLHCHQELLVFFWKICDYNKKFLYFVLKSSDVLDVLVPILYHLNDSRADQSRVGLMHIGVFILLLLSGERNFGVRLNKPYTATVPMDIPVFTGTHADLLVTVFHKIIATGHQRLQPLFDCLLTILVNVSPYLKTLSMVASIKLLHLLEAFSTPWFLYSAPANHHLVFFLLEIFNNIIQYQFDGNSNLVYTIIRKRHVFHALANLPSDMTGISRCLSSRKGGRRLAPAAVVKPPPQTEEVEEEEDVESEEDNKSENIVEEESMEGSKPALPAEPGTLKASLLDTPAIGQMTERESAHMVSSQSQETPALCDVNETLATLSCEDAKSETSSKSPATTPTASPKGTTGGSIRRSVAQRGSIRVTSTTASGGAANQVWTPNARVGGIMASKASPADHHATAAGACATSLLPVPHPILIRKYQANSGTTAWFRTYMWGVIYLRNIEPAIWYDTEVKLFEIQRV